MTPEYVCHIKTKEDLAEYLLKLIEGKLTSLHHCMAYYAGCDNFLEVDNLSIEYDTLDSMWNNISMILDEFRKENNEPAAVLKFKIGDNIFYHSYKGIISKVKLNCEGESDFFVYNVAFVDDFAGKTYGKVDFLEQDLKLATGDLNDNENF